MKATDTIMEKERVWEILDKSYGGSTVIPFGVKDAASKLLEAQAEVSFYAGRRDVLDLLRKTNVSAWEELLVYIGGGG